MNTKKFLAAIFIPLCVLILLLIVTLTVYQSKLISINDNQAVMSVIESKSDIAKPEICKTVGKQNYYAVYYKNEDNAGIAVFERDKIFKSKYKYLGGSEESSQYADYVYSQNEKSGNYTLIILCGDNSSEKYSGYNLYANSIWEEEWFLDIADELDLIDDFDTTDKEELQTESRTYFNSIENDDFICIEVLNNDNGNIYYNYEFVKQ